MADKLPGYVSDRTRRIMQLSAQNFSEDSDSDIDSDDSYVPEESYTSSSEHDTDSEISESEVMGLDCHLGEANSAHDTIEPSACTAIQEVDDDEAVEPNNVNIADPIEEDHDEPTTHEYYGKKKCFVWSAEPQCPRKSRSSRNIITARLSKPIGPALLLGQTPTPLELWRLFFTKEVCDKLVLRTNEKLEQMRNKLQNKADPSYKTTNNVELDALMGVLVLCCIFKSSRESLKSLFSTKITGRPIFRAIMSEKRCLVLLRALRFDDSTTRAVRLENDPGAAINNFFIQIMKNFQNNYSIGAYACIDETLVPFRGRCRFQVYMPQKPAKYGLKIVCITDARNSYLYDGYIYTGKGSDGATLTATEHKFKKPTQALIRLTQNIINTHRNVTCDNWFTSVEAAQWLWDKGLTIVGTLRVNKPQIPPEFLPKKTRPVNSSIYGFTKELTLVSYVPKQAKAVILLSSMHHRKGSDPMNGKPEIISLYNMTKSGVDILDMKCGNYSANRRTRRWPMAIFYHLIAVSASNAYVLHTHFHKKEMLRFDFMEQLGMALIHDHLQVRLTIPNIPCELRALITEALGNDQKPGDSQTCGLGPVVAKSDKLEKRKKCRYCPYQKQRVTSYKCVQCDTPTCLECSKKLCNDCVITMCK